MIKEISTLIYPLKDTHSARTGGQRGRRAQVDFNRGENGWKEREDRNLNARRRRRRRKHSVKFFGCGADVEPEAATP